MKKFEEMSNCWKCPSCGYITDSDGLSTVRDAENVLDGDGNQAFIFHPELDPYTSVCPSCWWAEGTEM